MAVSLAGRRAASIELRDVIARVIHDPDARLLRSGNAVSVVREHQGADDPRVEAEKLRRLVANIVEDDVSAGVAGPKPGSSGAHFALLQAEHALRLGRGLHGHGQTVHFDELGPFRFVLNQPATEVLAFSRNLLGPLAADARNDALVDTLEAYLRSSGAINVVARQLYLHRNTVRYRLHRIEKLTGADLGDPDTRLSMQLAILGWRAVAQIAS